MENTYDKLNKLTINQLMDLKESVISAGLFECDNYLVLELVLSEKQRAKRDEKFLQLLSKVV